MNAKRTAALVAGIVVAIVGAPIAGANPVSTQYDNPTPAVVTETPTVTATPTVTKTPTVKSASAKASGAQATGTVKKSKPVKVKAVKHAAKAVKPAVKAVVKPSPVANLPFTGLDLGIVVLFGGVAVAGGFGLRQIAARRHEDQ